MEGTIRESMTEGERAIFERGAESLSELQSGKAFDDWKPIIDGWVALREAAKRVMRKENPRGVYYNAIMAKACKGTAYVDMDKATRSNLIYCHDNKEAIARMREKWSPIERTKLNHPDTISKRLRKFLKAEAAGEPTVDEPVKSNQPSPYRKLQAELEEAKHQINVLRRPSDDGGNLWTTADSARDIATFLYPHFANMREDKCRKVIEFLMADLNADWNSRKRRGKRYKAGLPKNILDTVGKRSKLHAQEAAADNPGWLTGETE